MRRARVVLLMPSEEPVELIRRAFGALQRRAWGEAVQLAQSVLQRFGPEPNALMVLASVRAESGDLPGAIEFYERARALMPTHVHVLVNLAVAYRASGRLQDARRTLEAALQVDPRLATAHNNLGNVLSDLGERPAALRAYERAASLDGRYGEPVSGLARIAEEEHRLADARTLAERALELAPQNVLAALTLARVKLREQDAAGAAAILEVLLGSGTLSLTNRVLVQGYLGEAFDKLGRYADAFTAFTQANALQYQQYAASFGRDNGPLSPAGIGRLLTFVERTSLSDWGAAPPAARTPVFLIGFPRSGTTLLDQILASHPKIATLEERDTLADAAGELANAPEAFARWANLPGGEIERLRMLYWQRVQTASASESSRRVLIDKQPLNAVLLPLIYRLFPEARILLVLRDPRDAVLSCYQQRFGMNAAMYQLLRLDSATSYYDAVMRLVAAARAKMPLRLYTVRYEDVVAEFDATIRRLLAFLELEWNDAVRGYTETARRRAIGTPSAAQVVRPLYGSARGKWRNYAGFLAPYLPTLAPWVKAFGYDSA